MSAQDRVVAVLMGGWGSEAAVSRVSASFCSKAARIAGWDTVEVEFDRDIVSRLKELNPDRVLNALHGQIGEDGSVQGMLNVMNIPYTHSGVLASALAMDKVASGLIFTSVGISVPQLLHLIEDEYVYPADFTGTHVIKPRNDGSSVGVQIVTEDSAPPQRSLWDENVQLMAEEYSRARANCYCAGWERSLRDRNHG